MIRARGPGSPLVLLYHGVGERSASADPHNLFVPGDAVAAQLQTLLGAGWQPLSLDDYLAGTRIRRSFLVTFDDGYVSVRDRALPLLARFGVPAVCFVCTGLLGGRSAWMPDPPHEALLDADAVRDLVRGGVAIGGHGWDHSTMVGLGPDELRRNTEEVAGAIADLTGARPRAFAYPYGHHDAAARAAVAAAGHDVGFATYTANGPMAVPRVDVNARDTSRSFRLKTWPIYPAVRGALERLPQARAGLHRCVGVASRNGDARV